MMDPIEAGQKLDAEFDQFLSDLKPHVLRLPHKSERQRCALWIKKLCEPPGPGVSGRKNRNMYVELMLHMLKRGTIEGPFTQRPEDGPLATLPTYMSIYFDSAGQKEDEKQVPDWVAGLDESMAQSLLSNMKSSLGPNGPGEPHMSSTLRQSTTRERFHTLVNSPSKITGHRRSYSSQLVNRDRSPSPPRNKSPTHHSPRSKLLTNRENRGTYPSGDNYLNKERQSGPRRKVEFSSSDEENADDRYNRRKHRSPRSPRKTEISKDDWSHPVHGTSGLTSSRGTSYRDEHSLMKMHERELDMKTKMLEAQFHEEKLRLQQTHDDAVQKILNRKNIEIEEVKSHYRSKNKEQEETINKLDKKVQALVKESSVIRENKDKQIAELKKLAEESTQCKVNEFEKRLHDTIADFEQEKFDLQKQHTKNIQDLLDDTNTRLQKMETDYSQQTTATSSMIKELEMRIHQLTDDAETTTRMKNTLEREKIELDSKCERLMSELAEYQNRYMVLEKDYHRATEEHEQECRSLRNKTDASLEFMKQENSLAVSKADDHISDLEDQVSQLKQSLQDAENERFRKIRELEQVQQQDKLHTEHLHEKKVRSLQKEIDQLEQDTQKKIRKLEQTVKEKDDEIQKLMHTHKEQTQQSETALEDFKSQMEQNSTRMYDDMKTQMEKVEADLNRSKQVREKQAREFSKQTEELRQKHQQEIAELRLMFEQEKSQLIHNSKTERDQIQTEREQEVDGVRETLKEELRQLDERSRERQERDAQNILQLEEQLKSQREETVQSNQLRKQQLVELGLLREEEKQKLQRDHEAQVSKVKSQMEQQKLDLQKQNSIETEKMLEKTNLRLKEIEKEYTQRTEKQTETINDLHNTIQLLKQDQNRLKQQSEKQLKEVSSKSESEKRQVKRQHQGVLQAVQQEVENQKSRVRALERRLQTQQAESEQQMTELQLEHAEKSKGLLPVAVRQELEDTITSLKSQVNTLQQRSRMLQDELDSRSSYTPTSTKSPILAS
ncbi:unnamed protein product [Owenia fusiformis]|uniref:Uncharacterized protein n=1 Tax=Owenia fusiformis TaxID=6347 RepID=A0A8J1U8J7_OWEFU|nr:unnamed protein product [Owenia fusiformis]